MNRGPSLPRLLGTLVGVGIGVSARWLDAAAQAILRRC